jgi:hypothetical protein
MTVWGPTPTATEASAPHWDAARQGRLLVQRCSACSRCSFPPGLACPYCGGPLTWIESSGRGTIHTFTVVHRPPTPAVEVPYVVAVITLDEGWHMLSNVIDRSPDDVEIGQAVQVTFVSTPDGGVLPMFAPRDEPTDG